MTSRKSWPLINFSRYKLPLIFLDKNGIFRVMSGDFNWPIFGHKKQQDFLQTAIAQDRLAHTYIFYGPAGLGKKMIANYFAQSIFCQDKTARP